MRKPWVYQRPDRPGYYVGWYDTEGHRRRKRLPTKRIAGDFAAKLRHELNADLYVQPVSLSWSQLVAKYIDHKQFVEGKEPETVRQYANSFDRFSEIVGNISSPAIKQQHINAFIRARKQPKARKDGTEYLTSTATINKDLRHLKALFRWAIKSQYMGEPAKRLTWYQQKVEEKPVRSLNVTQLVSLLDAAGQLYGQAWVIRIILSLGTGLRQDDIETLAVCDIHLEDNTVASRSKKTNKVNAYRPVHPTIISMLARYMTTIDSESLFPDRYHHSKWRRIRKAAGIGEYKYHDLRRSFASFLSQSGYSTKVVQELLEHSSPATTTKYIQTNPVHRQAADSIPIDEIMQTLAQRHAGQPTP